MSYAAGGVTVVEEMIPSPTSGSPNDNGGELHHRGSGSGLDSSNNNNSVVELLPDTHDIDNNNHDGMMGSDGHEMMGDVDLSDTNYTYGNDELNRSNHSYTTRGRIGNINLGLGVTLPKKKSGVMGSSANLINSIVGAGIIGIPYAFKQSGLIAGLILLGLVAYLTDKSLRMIIEMASFNEKLLKIGGIYTYEDLASFVFGKLGSLFILFNMFILAYGAMVSYLIIIKDTVPVILGFAPTTDEDRTTEDNNSFPSWISKELILIIFTVIIILPLSIQRDMASLAFSSLLSITADIILCIFISIYAPIPSTLENNGGLGEVLKNDSINSTIFIGLGILSTAMACQHSSFIVANSLYNKTQKRWSIVTFYSISIAGILCAWLGTTGYLGFLQDTKGNILNNFDTNSFVANAARTLLAITMFFTYPMESFVARHVLIKLVHNGEMEPETTPHHIDDDALSINGDHITHIRRDSNNNNNSTTTDNGIEVTRTAPFFGLWTRRVKWTLGLYLMTLIPAIFIDDLGPVLSITGSIGGSCISYIAPGLLYLGIHGEDFLEWTNNILSNYNNKNNNNSSKKQHQKGDRKTGDIELPVAGDANQKMSTSNSSSINDDNNNNINNNGTSSTITKYDDNNNNINNDLTEEEQAHPISVYTGPESKPWFWYITFMPLWVAIASHGSITMKQKIQHYEALGRGQQSQNQQHQHQNNGNGIHSNSSTAVVTNIEGAVSSGGNNTINIVHSTKKDFIIAMFFVIFGLLAFACGLLSNIYIIINDIFFSPH